MKKLWILTLALLILCGCTKAPVQTTAVPTSPVTQATDVPTSSVAQVPTKTIYILTKETWKVTQNGVTETVSGLYYFDDNNFPIDMESKNQNGYTVATATFECDAYGQILTRTVTAGNESQTIEYTYDDRGLILTQVASREGQIVERYQCTYNEAGLMITKCYENIVEETTQSYSYEYQNGTLCKEEAWIDGELWYTVENTLDAQNRIAYSVMYDACGTLFRELFYSYSADGLTTTIENENGKSVEVRDEHGNVLSYSYEGVEGKEIRTYTYRAIEVPADSPRRNGI